MSQELDLDQRTDEIATSVSKRRCSGRGDSVRIFLQSAKSCVIADTMKCGLITCTES